MNWKQHQRETAIHHRMLTKNALCCMRLAFFASTILLLCSCQTSQPPRSTSLRECLQRRDFKAAEKALLHCPALINGEYVQPSSFDDDDRGETSFIDGYPLIAWFADDLRIVRWLIGKGAIVNLRTYGRGGSALHVASRAGNLAVVKLLLEKGALLKLEDLELHTPLFEAILNERYSVAEYLLENGAHINSSNSAGKTVLDQVIGEKEVIGHGDDFGGQERVAELKNAEVWIRRHGGKRSLEIAESWVKETRENERVHREFHEKQKHK